MEIVNLAPLLDAGIHGLLVIVLLIGWYERREIRRENYELIKLVMVAHPEANHTISSALKRKLQVVKNQAK
jgi:hypothetical protein